MKKEIFANGNTLVYEESIWTGKRTITINGRTLSKVKRNVYSDGTCDYVIKGSYYTGVTLEGPETYVIYEKLNVLQTILVFLPVVVCAFIGGAIGALFGAIASLTVASLTRKTNNTLVSFFVCIAATGIALVLWFIIAMFVLAGLQPVA